MNVRIFQIKSGETKNPAGARLLLKSYWVGVILEVFIKFSCFCQSIYSIRLQHIFGTS